MAFKWFMPACVPLSDSHLGPWSTKGSKGSESLSILFSIVFVPNAFYSF